MSLQVQIRPCTPDDATTLALIGQATFLETYSGILPGQNILIHCAEQHSGHYYQHLLADTNHSLWLVEIDPGSAPIGYMVTGSAQGLLPGCSEYARQVKRIYLFSRFQRRGLGRQLITTAVSEARHLGAQRLLLGVYKHNTAAISFYRQMGFQKSGERKFNMGGLICDDYVLGLSLSAAE